MIITIPRNVTIGGLAAFLSCEFPGKRLRAVPMKGKRHEKKGVEVLGEDA